MMFFEGLDILRESQKTFCVAVQGLALYIFYDPETAEHVILRRRLLYRERNTSARTRANEYT
jgi:hypothetical protein